MMSEVDKTSQDNGEVVSPHVGLSKMGTGPGVGRVTIVNNRPDVHANRDFLQALIDGKKLPSHINNVEVAFTVQQMGRELGFATMQAFHYIIPIQGKLSLSAKATGALLRNGGVRFQTMEDAVKIFANGTTTPSTPEDLPVDVRTTIKFIRDGLEEVTSFTWTEAAKQGLTTKDNWVRMPQAMLWARCLSKGANRVGADLLLGLYTTEELYDALGTKDTKVVYDDDGHIKEVIE